ncbi:MAG: DUF6850 family outer membrane beta-barrel protein [Candidatus Zhuqueibacterota bacterium]
MVINRYAHKALIIIVILTLSATLAASDLRVQSMGQLKLILEDKDNQLNLYDFGANPAWLIKDQTRSWLRSYFTTDMFTGDFRRIYDPESTVDLNAFVEGVKVMGKNQVFHGVVDYHNLSINNVYQAINRNPYEAHPFRLADNTTGSINYWGPTISAEYSRNIFQDKLFFGASLEYQIETGLKDYFPQSRTLYRYASLGTGLAYIVNDQLSLGATFTYSHTQEFTECIPPSSNDPRSIIVMKFRGETMGSERIGEMERFTKTAHYQIGFQSNYRPVEFVESAVNVRSTLATLDATESRSKPVKDGTWELGGYEIHWANRLHAPNVPFLLGFSIDRIYYNDWAKHPRFDLLLGDDHFAQNVVGCGLAFEPETMPLSAGIEASWSAASVDKKDYVSHLFANGDVTGRELKCGAEVRLLQGWAIRAGYLYRENETEAALLDFSEFLPAHSAHIFTWGLGLSREGMESDLYAYIGRQRPTDTPGNAIRDMMGVIFSIKFFMK